MRQEAEKQAQSLKMDSNSIKIMEGHSGKIDLADKFADVMTYSQALHWYSIMNLNSADCF